MMQAKSIFLACLKVPTPEARRAHAERACKTDPALREHVLALLAAHEESDPRPPPPIEGEGAMIGPYKLLEEIGEGGFGVVYVAEQTAPVRRRVALKVIKAGMDTREVVARFEAERQALAIMDHPHIARVFDGGSTPGGRPYFVMELVKGIPITEYSDQCHLTLAQRLELFGKVCKAVQHAHQKGVIHRDLKPSNILVEMEDGHPAPKVIDFGIAKATGARLTEATFHTRFAQMIGTPLYMSPEQAEMSALDVDTRSDVYSLGVLLYELLTGTTPLTSERLKTIPFDELRRIIREEDPPTPSGRLTSLNGDGARIAENRRTEIRRLVRLVHGELDWIVMKALEKDRTRRYETATALAADVGRYLGDEPVEAGPPSRWYRSRKFVRRHRAPLAMTAIALAAVLAGAGFLLKNAARRDTIERQIVAALRKTETDYRAGRRSAAMASLEHAEGLATGGGASAATMRRVTVWRQDLKMIDALEDLRLSQSTMLNDGGETKDAMAASYEDLFTNYGLNVLEFDGQFTPQMANSPIRAGLVVALVQWRRREARTDLRKRIDRLVDALDPDTWRLRLRDAARKADKNTLKELAGDGSKLNQPPEAWIRLAFALVNSGDRQAGIEVFRAAQIRHPGDFWIHRELAVVLGFAVPPNYAEALACAHVAAALQPGRPAVITDLAYLMMLNHDFDRAEITIREALRLRPGFAHAHNVLGAIRNQKGDTEGAIVSLEKAIEIGPATFDVYTKLSMYLLAKGDVEGAITAGRRGVELGPNSGFARSGLGDALYAAGRHEEGIAEYHEAIRLAPQKPYGHHGLGRYLCDIKRDYVGAIAKFREALRLFPPNDPDTHVVWSSLGNALSGNGELDASIDAYKKAIQLGGHCHNGLGNALKRKGDRTAAVAAYREAIELNPANGGAYYGLGQVLRESGDTVGAIDAYRKSIERGGTRSYLNYGVVLAKHGDHEAAIDAYRKAIDLGLDKAMAHNNLASSLKDKGEFDAALRHHAEAIRIQPDKGINHYSLGATFFAMKRYDKAAAAFQTAVDLKFVQAYSPLATALHRNGDLDGAIEAYKKANELDPNRTAVHYSLGRALKSNGDLDGAIAAYRKASELDPKHTRAHMRLAWALREIGRPDEAIVHWKKALSTLPPNDAWSHYWIAWELAASPDARMRDPKRAVQLAKRSIELERQDWESWCTLGVALYYAGDDQAAIDALRESMRLQKLTLKRDGTAWDWFFLAMAHWKLDQKDEARKWYGHAAAWMKEHNSTDEEFRRFQAEARELLEIEKTNETNNTDTTDNK